VGAVVLVGTLLVTSVVVADDDNSKNPFTQILAKLDQILSKLNGSDNGNHTLRWDTNYPSATRFTTAFTGAVLDKNTGLVWEQAPSTMSTNQTDATSYCINKNVGGTRGWRLPSVPELTSLIDPSLPAPFVPASIFTGVYLGWYWSATSSDGTLGRAWYVLFFDSSVSSQFKGKGGPTYGNFRAWCVRGDMNAYYY
jgi:hypothetical protein